MTGSRASQLYRTKRLSGRPTGPSLVAVLLVAAAALIPASARAASPQSDALAKARLFYNQRQYDQAIQTAEKALTAPAVADSARVVIGRAYLERFRQSADEADLVAGREALRQVQAAALTARDHADLLIGLGECLYLDNEFGAASELFSSAIGASTTGEVRDSLLDWWASSMERVALQGPVDDRADYYDQIVYRMDEELVRDPTSTPASYWLAAASRGSGDVERAWDAALAGWVRSLLSPGQGAALRADLDHLMTTAIIPERARLAVAVEIEHQAPAERTAPDQAVVDRVVEGMAQAWEEFKANWK